jgi:hypothetical protein
MAEKLVIKATGKKDRADLSGCYFVPSGSIDFDSNDVPSDKAVFELHHKNDKKLDTDPSQITNTTTSFKFELDDIEWTVSEFAISLTGKWTNNDRTAKPKHKHGKPYPDTGPESGDFTAVAGSGGSEEKALPASASSGSV